MPSITLPDPVRNYLVAEYLSIPVPQKADFGTGTPEPVVFTPFEEVAAVFIRHGVDLLPTLDLIHDAGYIEDVMADGSRYVGIRKTILDMPAAIIVPKAGRKTDPTTAKIVNTILAERKKGTPWKDIPEIVKLRHRGKILSVETLKDMVKPSKLLKFKPK